MLDLIVTLDDATSAIYSAFLVEEEGTASTFRALEEVFGRNGLPLSLYTDRGLIEAVEEKHWFAVPLGEPSVRAPRALPHPAISLPAR